MRCLRTLNEDYLLRFVEIGDVPLFVNASPEVARAGPIARASADEAKMDPATANIGLAEFKG
jgi:hypothetical protein